VAAELKQEAEQAFADWKAANPALVLDDLPFYIVGEVYGWGPSNGRLWDFGDRTVDYFDFGYDGLINIAFKQDINGPLDDVFARYATSLRVGALRGVAILNYVSSHDDPSPYDPARDHPFEAATRLLLAPGGTQIYYGDELARPLAVTGARGDANLRSFMNWDDLAAGGQTAEILAHWRKLGRFRRAHPAVGIGEHRQLQADPYVFSRILELGERTDRVVVALEHGGGTKTVPVAGVFADGTELVDAYSGQRATVRDGAVILSTESTLVLLSEPQ
jgi:alpha-amylase